jgi:hypothetical protein
MEKYMFTSSICFRVLVITDKLFEQWHVINTSIIIKVYTQNYKLYPVIFRFTKMHHTSSEFFRYLLHLRNAILPIDQSGSSLLEFKCDKL